MHYIYKITNQLNDKVYIGQSRKPDYRWYQHRSHAKGDKSPQYIHHAMAKYGIDNFKFEIIDVGLNQWHADCLELNYIKTYDSQNKEKGYNIKAGGNVSPHSEETKQKQSEATLLQIEIKGHPATGRIVTDAEKELHRKERLENPLEYTPELRQKMSEAHLGIKDSEETKAKKSEAAKIAWEERIGYSRQCQAPGCTVSGKAKYKIIDGVRYCNMHGLRMLRYGRLETQT